MRRKLLVCSALVALSSLSFDNQTYAKSASEYTYTITPLIDQFNEYIYVKTDNPDVSNIKFIDNSTVYGDAEYAYFELDTNLYADVVYEDELHRRVKGGYLFRCGYSNSDGGELSLHYKDKDTGVKVNCPKLVDYETYLIDNYTSTSKSFFENLDSVQEALDTIALYPRGLRAESETGMYPALAVSPYHELSLNDHYENVFDKTDYRLLNSWAYPFVLDSLGFPSVMCSIAKTLNPNCETSYDGIHWLRTITLDGESRSYGGAGNGGYGDDYVSCVNKTFTFSGDSSDLATHGTLAKYRDEYFEIIKRSGPVMTKYTDMLDEVRTTESSWYLVAVEGWRADNAFAYLYREAGSDYNYVLSETWVDGRYIDEYESWVPGAKFADYPNADVVVPNYTFTDPNGEKRTETKRFYYDGSTDKWRGSYTYMKKYGSYSYMAWGDVELTRNEIKALNVDKNTDTNITTYRICDGTKKPGTKVAVDMTWSVSNGTLTVNCKGDTLALLGGNKAPWADKLDTITSLVIGSGTTNISENSFSGLPNVTSITIADTVEEIQKYAFRCCGNLKTVTLPKNLRILGDYAFDQCPKLESITLPATLEYIGSLAFNECKSLKKIVIPAKIKKLLYGLFMDCEALEEVSLPSGLSFIDTNTFSGCKKLSKVSIPDNVSYIGNYAFMYCESLPEIIIPKSVTHLGYHAFSGCSSAEKISISDISVLDMGTFSGCSSVTEIELPKSVKMIESSVFSGCTKLEKIVLPEGLEKIGGHAFSGCYNLRDVDIPSTVTEIENGAFWACQSLDKINIPYGITELGEDLFKYAWVKQVGVPLSMTDVSFLNGAYYVGCIFYRGSKSDWDLLPGAENLEYVGKHFKTSFGEHTLVVTPGVPPTFESDGYSDTSYCSECGLYVQEWTYLPKLEKKGWQSMKGKWYYFPEEGKMATGWRWIDGSCYFFNQSGAMQTGWYKEDGCWYYLDANGHMAIGWAKVDGSWYYFSDTGSMVTGWRRIAGEWHYFNPSGCMVSGWQKIQGQYYYFNTNGYMLTGWQKISGKWYYLKPSGEMATNWLKLDNCWYYFGTSGAMSTGWVLDAGCWYYMRETGVMSTGWTQIGSKWYYFNASGAMLVDWRLIDGHWYYFTSSGYIAIGWYEIDNKYYYFNSNGYMMTGWQRINAKWYYFTGSGDMVANTKLNISGKVYSFDANGVCLNP